MQAGHDTQGNEIAVPAVGDLFFRIRLQIGGGKTVTDASQANADGQPDAQYGFGQEVLSHQTDQNEDHQRQCQGRFLHPRMSGQKVSFKTAGTFGAAAEARTHARTQVLDGLPRLVTGMNDAPFYNRLVVVFCSLLGHRTHSTGKYLRGNQPALSLAGGKY